MASWLWGVFFYIISMQEARVMYDNDDLLMFLDDDLFPVEEDGDA